MQLPALEQYVDVPQFENKLMQQDSGNVLAATDPWVSALRSERNQVVEIYESLQ